MTARGLEAALWGTATRDAEVRQSKAGNEFAIVNAIVYDGTADEQGRQIGQFAKILAFGQHVNAARTIRKGDRCYAEGQLTASIWKTNDGEPRLDLSIRAFKLEKTAIGKNRPPRDTSTTGYQAPIEPARQQHEFDDSIPF